MGQSKYGDKAKIPKEVSEIPDKAVRPEKADKPDKNAKGSARGSKQIREWIWVEDNVKQILKLMLEPDIGTFNIGSGECLQNIDIIKHIGDLIGKEPKYEFVEDRLGHDRRYTLDTDFVKPKITKTLFEYLEEQL